MDWPGSLACGLLAGGGLVAAVEDLAHQPGGADRGDGRDDRHQGRGVLGLGTSERSSVVGHGHCSFRSAGGTACQSMPRRRRAASLRPARPDGSLRRVAGCERLRQRVAVARRDQPVGVRVALVVDLDEHGPLTSSPVHRYAARVGEPSAASRVCCTSRARCVRRTASGRRAARRAAPVVDRRRGRRDQQPPGDQASVTANVMSQRGRRGAVGDRRGER